MIGTLANRLRVPHATLNLSGCVSAFFLRQLAQQVLRKQPGMRAIVHNVEAQVSNQP